MGRMRSLTVVETRTLNAKQEAQDEKERLSRVVHGEEFDDEIGDLWEKLDELKKRLDSVK